jgi:hypothetical protein
VDTRVLRGDGEDGEGVGVLPADERAGGAEVGLEDPEAVSLAPGVHQALPHGRHDLLAPPEERPVRPQEDLAVVQGAGRARTLLAHADHDVRTGLRGRPLQPGDLRPRDLDRVLEELDAQLGGDPAGPGVEVEPDRVGRDETLGERDDVGAVRPRLVDEGARLVDGRLAVEEHRRRLDRSGTDLRHLVAHADLYPSRADTIDCLRA